MTMSQELLNELKNLNKKIDVLIRFNIYDKIRDKSQKEQIKILSDIKFRNFEIAEMLETTQNNVNVVLSKIRGNKKDENK